MNLEWISLPEAWVGLLTLVILEIVLGIDNIIFISILSGKLPKEDRAKARRLGLLGALVTRILLLLSIAWVMKLTKPLFQIPFLHEPTNGKDLVLIIGGLFLIWKSVHEIHHKLEGHAEESKSGKVAATLGATIAQIMVIDIVFSLDSVITAVGMVKWVEVMILAVLISVGFMLMMAGKVSDFVDAHPTVKMLALAFLVLIGVNLIAEGTGAHIDKNYTYFAMGFAVMVEMLNIKMKKSAEKPVELRETPHLKPGSEA